MTLLTIILLMIGLYILFLFSKKSSKKRNDGFQKNHIDFVKTIRGNWELIKVKTSDCQIIKFDTIVPENSFTKRNESFFEWLNKDPHRKKMINEKRAKLICNVNRDNKAKRQFVKVVQIDHTVFEFKVRMQHYIDVYVSKDKDSEEYYIDLDFLNQTIK